MPTLTTPSARQVESAPTRRPDLPDVYEKGRACEQAGCITILCRLNPGPACFVHTEPEYEGRVNLLGALACAAGFHARGPAYRFTDGRMYASCERCKLVMRLP